MRVEYRKSFVKDLRSIPDKKVLDRLQQVIRSVEAADRPEEILHLKKLKGEERRYRIRVGEYRVGLVVEGDLVVFVRVLSRKEIYRYFP